MFNIMLPTICVISDTIFDELEFVPIILLLMEDLYRSKQKKTKIILIHTKDSAERERTTDELGFQQWYANDDGNNTDNNTDTFDNVSFNSKDDQNVRTINNEFFSYMSLNCFGIMNYGFSRGFGTTTKTRAKTTCEWSTNEC